MGESIVPCEAVTALAKEEASVVVMVTDANGPVDGIALKLKDSAQSEKKAASKATFKGLAKGAFTVEVELTPAQLAKYEKPPLREATFKEGTAVPLVVKLATNDIGVAPFIRLNRSRGYTVGAQATSIRFELKVEAGNPKAMEGLKYTLLRSRAEIDVYTDEACTAALTFDAKQVAPLDAVAATLGKNQLVHLWAKPKVLAQFALTLQVVPVQPPPPQPAKVGPASRAEFKNSQKFLVGPSRFLELVDSFRTVKEIEDGIKKVRSLAALADMRTDEFANFAIKRLFIREGVLEQPVVIEIDGKKVALKHPQTEGKHPLHYSDFIVDRSGPKFLGALDAGVAVEALMYKEVFMQGLIRKARAEGLGSAFDVEMILDVRDLAVRRFESLLKRKPDLYEKLEEDEIEMATCVFEQKHQAQRKLSDFDLTARETETLARAIGIELKKVAALAGIKDSMILEVGRLAWASGGKIDTRRIKDAIDRGGPAEDVAVQAYAAAIEADPKCRTKRGVYKGTKYKELDFYHLLIQEVGAIACKLLEKSEPHVDDYYGLGIPFMGPQVLEKNGAFVQEPNPKEHDLFEIGDIITDETSHYGTVFSHNLNVETAFGKLNAIQHSWSFADFDDKQNLRDNCVKVLEASGQEQVLADYRERSAFIDTILMFEQVSKKEAQAQLFRRDMLAGRKAKADGADEQARKDGKEKEEKNAGKLMGNVSDVSQFLHGIGYVGDELRKAGKNAEAKKLDAMLDVVKLSCLIAMPRWGVTEANVEDVKNTADEIGAEQFAASINERSYAHEAGDFDAPRIHLEWAQIDSKIGAQRLKDFKDRMTPVWSFLHQQKAFFKGTDALITAIRTKANRSAARTAIKAALDTVVKNGLPALASLMSADEKTALIAALTGQAEESAQFQVTRVPNQ